MAQVFWAEFGLLCHSIITKPMDGAALVSASWDKMKSTWIKRSESLSPGLLSSLVPNAEEKKNRLMRVGVWAFKMALRGDPKSTLTFLYPNYLARFHAKLGSDNKVFIFVLCKIVTDMFKQSCKLAPTDWYTKDKDQEIVIEPYYRLLSYLCKRLVKDEISPDLAHKTILDIVPVKWLILSDAIDANGVNDGRTQSKNDVFKLISDVLRKFMQIDKKKWMHKLYWKV